MTKVAISAAFAQQIVDSAKSIVARDINYIDENGIIIASTDPKRIGEFHEIGYHVIKNQTSTEVTDDSTYQGTKKGINYPIYLEEKVVGVIGITGDPEEVSKYGFLLTKISEIFMKEYLLEINNLTNSQRTNRLLLSLLYHDIQSMQQLMNEYQIERNRNVAVIQIMISSKCNPKNLSMIERDIIQEFKQSGIEMYTYIYPNEMVCIVNEKQYQKLKNKVAYYASKYSKIINVGIGTMENIEQTYISYHFAKIATHHSQINERFVTFAENMNLELLIGSLEEKIKNEYYDKIIGSLDTEDMNTLKIYFRNDMSLKQTADELFIHKNTLQYKLNHIKEKTGYDPRNFKNAVVMYLAVRMKCYV